eukprot:scaffold21538_cov41-Cyclotella_meneghiniana.AAC.5
MPCDLCIVTAQANVSGICHRTAVPHFLNVLENDCGRINSFLQNQCGGHGSLLGTKISTEILVVTRLGVAVDSHAIMVGVVVVRTLRLCCLRNCFIRILNPQVSASRYPHYAEYPHVNAGTPHQSAG